MSSYQPVPVPFLGKNPIPAGAPGFYERDEAFVEVQNLLRAGDSVSLVGERKAGKTSFLNYLLTHLSDDEFIPAFVDAQEIAPKTDKMFLGELAVCAAETIAEKVGLSKPVKVNTLTAQPEEAYQTFRDDLKKLRAKLPLNSKGQKYRFVWLIDEIEILRGYEKTELFTFLRPLAQADPDFRLVMAGYDVLYTLSSRSEWSPFFNAFRHIRLEGLNPVVAQQMIDDAMTTMRATIDSNLYQSLFAWTGQKPYFLKWTLSKTAEALNQRQTDYHVNADLAQTIQQLFLSERDLNLHFTHLWQTHTTPGQQTVLSLIAAQVGPYNYPTILNDLKEKKLIEGDKQAAQHLIDDLTRLQQLGFLYERVGEYTFTSDCLKTWIKENKPLS